MSSLRELQERAYRAIVLEQPLSFGPRSRVAADGLDVYRNNARETFRRALEATYPVVARLVGEACFRSLAHVYMRDFPSRSGDLGAYGAEFPRLLEVYYRDTEYGYLEDVARLEAAIAHAACAADAPPFDAARLAAIEEREYAALRFALHPTVGLLSSRAPVLTVLQAHAAEKPPTVDLRAGAEHVLVLRRALRVAAYRLDAGTFAFARSLADGDSLGDAHDTGAAAADAFDVRAALAKLALLGALADVRVAAREAA